MHLKQFFWIAPTTLLLIVSQTPRLNFPVSSVAFAVVAQTSDARKAEADRLLEQGIKQYRTSQLEAALQSFQKALTTYQKIGERRSEGVILNNIGAVYRSLRNYSRALEFYQQALTIHREVGSRAGEGILLSNIGVVYENLDSQQPIYECLRKSQQPVAQCYGDFRALKHYQQALALAREVGERNRENVILVAIGDLIRGDY